MKKTKKNHNHTNNNNNDKLLFDIKNNVKHRVTLNVLFLFTIESLIITYTIQAVTIIIALLSLCKYYFAGSYLFGTYWSVLVCPIWLLIKHLNFKLFAKIIKNCEKKGGVDENALSSLMSALDDVVDKDNFGI